MLIDSNDGFCDSLGEPNDAPDQDAEPFIFIFAAFTATALLLWWWRTHISQGLPAS
jgi:hypothetical protein